MADRPKTEDPDVTQLRETFDAGNAAADGMTLTQLLVRNEIDGTVELHKDREPIARLRDDARRYQIGDLIAKGGMGAVFDARDNNTCRHVAMKVMLETAKTTEESLVRFIEEAQITGQREQPNIVPIHELGVDTT